MQLAARTLADLELEGRLVLVRVDFNVPVDAAGRITDDTRIRAVLPTLNAILEGGGRPVCLCHFGRPAGQVVESLRVDALGKRLGELLLSPVRKLDLSIGEALQRTIAETPAGTTLLLENVRFHPGETRGDDQLARAYARLGDCFVGDAFGACHRDHASVSGIPRHLPAAAGLLLEKELRAFRRVLLDPERPLVAVLGGAKVSDKLPVVDNLLDRVDTLLVGGAMAYTFLLAGGASVGDSLVEPELVPLCAAALEKAARRGVELLLPSDHLVAERCAADADVSITGPDIPAGSMGLDIGPETAARFAECVRSARTVVWNGPMGVFEMEAFRGGTQAVGTALGECAGYTVVGGGDSVAAIHLLGLKDAIAHISTGGGASLELLEGRELPGIAALRP